MSNSVALGLVTTVEAENKIQYQFLIPSNHSHIVADNQPIVNSGRHDSKPPPFVTKSFYYFKRMIYLLLSNFYDISGLVQGMLSSHLSELELYFFRRYCDERPFLFSVIHFSHVNTL